MSSVIFSMSILALSIKENWRIGFPAGGVGCFSGSLWLLSFAAEWMLAVGGSSSSECMEEGVLFPSSTETLSVSEVGAGDAVGSSVPMDISRGMSAVACSIFGMISFGFMCSKSHTCFL